MAFVGRSFEMAQVEATGSNVVLITGDEGIGKSTVLAAVQRSIPDAVAPSIVSVRRSPAALQLAMLDAFAGGVALLTQDQPVIGRLADLAKGVAARLAEDRLRAIGPAVGRHLLDLVRTKVSPGVADLIAEVAHDLSTSVDERLAERITAASSPDVIDVILAFAEEIVVLASGRPVVVALDDLHRLDEDDIRRLGDLVETLPSGVRIVGAFTTSTASDRDRADRLATDGVEIVRLLGLTEGALRTWLAEEGLDDSIAVGILRVTNGYPFHIANAVNLLKGGQTPAQLDLLEPTAVVVAGTRRCWRELDPYSQQAAQQLAPFQDPLDASTAADYLNMSVPAWVTLEARLTDSGLFTAADQPWFHELRRRALWDEVLTADQRSAAISAAFAQVHGQLELPGSTPDVYVLYARLAAQSPALVASDPQVAALVTAGAADLAVLAALMELAEFTRGQPAVLAEAVLTHARQTFSASGDLVAALHRLADAGLVVVSADNNATLVVPAWRSREVSLLIAARSAADLGRRPIPDAATALFEGSLRPKLGSFKSASYGIGWPRVAELSERSRVLQSLGPDGLRIIGRKGPNILLRATQGALPFYMSAAFETASDRDAALSRLAGLNEDVWDGRLRAVDVVAHPTECVQSRRFILAAEVLTGLHLGSSRSTIGMQPETAGNPSIDEQMERRTAILAAMRDRSSQLERYAYGLEQPVGFIYDGDAKAHVRAEVRGLTQSRRLHIPRSMFSSQPFDRFDLIRSAGLGSNEQLGTIHMTTRSRDDPVLDELFARHQRAVAFNNEQDPVHGVLSQSWLQPAMAASMAQAQGDVAALSMAMAGEQAAPGKTFLLLVELAESDQWVPGAVDPVIYAEVDEDPGNIDARIDVLPRGSFGLVRSFADEKQFIADHFGVDPGRIGVVGGGDALGRIAELLGHTDREIRLTYA